MRRASVELDGDHAARPMRERMGQTPGPGTDLPHDVVPRDPGVDDQVGGDQLVTEGMLSETDGTARRPRSLGHGGSP
jgi:hypothetical protein